MSTATLGSTFKCVRVNDLSDKTIKIIRASNQPSYTDNEDNNNDLFHTDSLVEWLLFLKEKPDESDEGFSPKDYRSAIDELEAISGLKEFDYISIGTVE